MYTQKDSILIIPDGNQSYFFDPESMVLFSKEKHDRCTDEEIIGEYKKSLPISKKDVQNWNDPRSVDVELHVTDDCNLRCKYCYIGENCKKSTNRQMSEEVIEKAFLFTNKFFPKAKQIHISLFGGEPLLFWKKFSYIIDQANKNFQGKNFSIRFPTNGTIVNEEILSFLQKHDISFQISFDGDKKQQDQLRPCFNNRSSYDLIDKNLPQFLKIRKFLSVRATLTPQNLHMKELFLFFKKKGFQKINFCLCSSSKNDLIIKEKDLPVLFQESERLFDCYLQHLIQDQEIVIVEPLQRFIRALHFGNTKTYYCGSGKNLFAVAPDGRIYSCHRMIGNDAYQIGDLENGFFDNRKSFLQFHVDQEKHCENCFAKYACGGGCTHEKSLSFLPISCEFTRYMLYLTIKLYANLTLNYPDVLKKLTTKLEKQQDIAVSHSGNT